MDDVFDEAQRETGPILRLITRGLQRVGQIVGNDREMYFERGADRTYNEASELWEGGPRLDSHPAQARNWMDPVHARDFLGAVVEVTRGGSGQIDYAQELTRVDAIVDLRTAALPQMVGRHLESRLPALPLSVWFDDDGLVRRLRYETTPPESEKPMHRRLEFFDFGAPRRTTPHPGKHIGGTSLTIAVPPPSVSVGD